MVTFNKESFTITVNTVCNPGENWKCTIDELVEMHQCLNTDLTNGKQFYHALELIREMLPDIDQAIKFSRAELEDDVYSKM